MVVSRRDDAEVDRVFHALADRTRRDIVARTMHGDHSVSALARRYSMSVTAVQKHVGVLEDAGLVRKERRGREQIVRCDLEGIRMARALLDQLEDLWHGRIGTMRSMLRDERKEPTP